MKPSSWINPLLFLALLGTTTLCWVLPERDASRPNFEFLPEAQMVQSPAFESFAPNPNFADGLTLRTPPAGTIVRGHPRLRYQPTLQDALRAGEELQNPFQLKQVTRLERGTAVYTNFCQVCHGPLGLGNGPLTQGGFPPPASLLAERAVQMKDGQMFHVLTYGQGNMPSFSTQLSRDDRWSVILHIRMLQGYAPSGATSRFQEVTQLFRQNCAACHGEDGKGVTMRKILPLIPDFTSQAWQLSQTELALVNQIDYGSAPLMPAFRYKLTREQVLGLAVYIRSFAVQKSGEQPLVAPSSHLTPANIYVTYCFACHDTNGKGITTLRASMPELPDFSSPVWQKTRTDAELAQSILQGKGKFMLSQKDKLGTVDVKELVALVRGFQGGKQIIALEAPKVPGPLLSTTQPDIPASIIASATARAGGLPNLWQADLVAQTLTRPTALLPPGIEPKPPTVAALSEEESARIRIGATIYRQFCFVCHGMDGTGSVIRASMPPIPDFTIESFHKQHNDAQIRVSILEGKGTLMPANRGRVTEDQARDLVAYIRSFGPESVRIRPEASDKEFEKAFRQLEEQLQKLHQEMEKVKGKQ